MIVPIQVGSEVRWMVLRSGIICRTRKEAIEAAER